MARLYLIDCNVGRLLPTTSNQFMNPLLIDKQMSEEQHLARTPHRIYWICKPKLLSINWTEMHQPNQKNILKNTGMIQSLVANARSTAIGD